MTAKRRAEEAQAASAELAPSKKPSRERLAGTIRSCEENAARMAAAGMPNAAARAYALADRARANLRALDVTRVTDESRAA